MLFSSSLFVFVFFPAAWIGYWTIGLRSRRAAILWMALVSVVFYARWSTHDLAVLAGSTAANYLFALAIGRAGSPYGRKVALVASLVADLGLLAFYKYAGFVLGWFGIHWAAGGGGIGIPLGISFFTFTQIAYLVDVHKGAAPERNIVRYVLFVTYFPHLIAGPVIHHGEMMPQFREERSRMEPTLFLSGLSVFFLGLFKKLVLADTLAGAANLGFDQVANGVSLGTSAAWLAVLSYTLQIYFDFSGYSDMAVGISACFGIRLPVNFDSPYRASSMIEFWRRWHMSLSRFLREYVYIPLGGNRKGKFLRYANLLATMLIGGFWHGAGWTFIAWGAIHGVALAANHLWRDECAPNWPRLASSRVWHGFSKVLVLGVAVLAWVFFRSGTVPASLAMLGHLFHRNGGDPGSPVSWVAVVVSLAIALFLPSVQEIYRKQRVALPERSETVRDYPWVLSWRWILVVAVLAGIALGAMGRDKLFLYFNF